MYITKKNIRFSKVDETMENYQNICFCLPYQCLTKRIKTFFPVKVNLSL
jgi:hypothetical protein